MCKQINCFKLLNGQIVLSLWEGLGSCKTVDCRPVQLLRESTLQYSIMNMSMRPEVSVQSGVVHVTRTRPRSLVNTADALTLLGADSATLTSNTDKDRHVSGFDNDRHKP